MLVYAALLASHSPAAAQDAPTALRIVLVGDSTVASKSGWGDVFAKLLSPGVECLNPHLSAEGAAKTAALVVDEIRKNVPELHRGIDF